MKKLTLLSSIAALSACNSTRHDAENAVRETLKDPESARFGEFYYNDATKKGCLTVNAKNSMGGYTGDEQAYLEQNNAEWKSIAIADVSQDSCRRVHADRVD